MQRDADRAVTSVLGIVLLVAVTIVLAAVLGTFVFGIGAELTEETPTATFEIRSDPATAERNASLFLIHSGGDGLPADELEVIVDGETVWDRGAAVGDYETITEWAGEVTVGDRLEVEDHEDGVIDGANTVRVVQHGDERATVVVETTL